MEYLKPFYARNLSSINTIRHGFFGSHGGVSTGLYKSLNCGYGSNDIPKNVKENRNRVAQNIGTKLEYLLNPYQIHSNLAVYIDKPFPKDGPKCDAFVTDKPNLALAILTADCAPILFCDENAKIIGAAHAGWKGAISGIIENTIALMIEKGASLENIKAAIGPCIAQESYEVGQDFYDNFITQAPDNKRFFKDGQKAGKYQFSLKAYCASRLKSAGVTDITILPEDTCALENQFHSNRRRNQRNEPDYGRNISVIIQE